MDSKYLYLRYLPGTVRFITAFAKEIPLFKSLNQTDQRILIKSGILEISAIYDSSHIDLDTADFVNKKLNLCIPKYRLESIGLIGLVFSKLISVVERLRRLNLTDVELSLLAAMVLFCPGE